MGTVEAFVINATVYDFEAQTGHYHGLWNRISLVIALTWLGALAVRLRRDQSGTPPQAARHRPTEHASATGTTQP